MSFRILFKFWTKYFYNVFRFKAVFWIKAILLQIGGISKILESNTFLYHMVLRIGILSIIKLKIFVLGH
jgi:hypothetical protein